MGKRQAAEEVDRKRRDVAERKLKAQSLLDDASEFLSDVAVELPKAEKAGQPLLGDERLSSAALRGASEATESALQALDIAFAGVQAKLGQASETLREDLKQFLRPELQRM